MRAFKKYDEARSSKLAAATTSRRLITGGVAVLIVLAGALRLAIFNDVPGSERARPVARVQQSDSRVPVTPRALAAALSSLTGLTPPYAAYGKAIESPIRSEEGSAGQMVRVMLEYPGGFVWASVSTDSDDLLSICDDPSAQCRHRVLDSGERAVIAHTEPRTRFVATVDSVIVIRADATTMVSAGWWDSDDRAVLPVADLLSIAADPKIGLRIDPVWNVEGEQMTQFDKAQSEAIFEHRGPA